MTGVPDTDPFNRLVTALEPWLDQVVIIGGRAHQLYRLHPSAQNLDYLPLTTLDTDIAVPAKNIEILLSHPWTIDLGTATVRVANPVAFLAQKILIRGRRERLDRAKDILYMHDTLEVFGERLAELAALWRTDVAGQLHRRSARVVSKASEVLFGDLNDDIRRAARISTERAQSAEDIRAACRYGLAELFSVRK